jgi:hypothetical protein
LFFLNPNDMSRTSSKNPKQKIHEHPAVVAPLHAAKQTDMSLEVNATRTWAVRHTPVTQKPEPQAEYSPSSTANTQNCALKPASGGVLTQPLT